MCTLTEEHSKVFATTSLFTVIHGNNMIAHVAITFKRGYLILTLLGSLLDDYFSQIP